ncbi:MAG TPA: hypothetical protein VFK05_24195 [Polyangiaceae bacterium]|nr:hypothetical protein [Polyangiaceae bacterium]
MNTRASIPPSASGLAFLACCLCASCHTKSEPSPSAVGSALTSNQALRKPVDRLAPDELAAGNAEVWGFAVPREMQVEHRYKEATHLIGPVKPDALANYVRERVVVSHVEIGAARTIFPDARIKGGAVDHVYELEVIPEPGITRLIIRDTTPPKVVPGLTDAERWRQAGLTPEGRPLDPKAFE